MKDIVYSLARLTCRRRRRTAFILVAAWSSDRFGAAEEEEEEEEEEEAAEEEKDTEEAVPFVGGVVAGGWADGVNGVPSLERALAAAVRGVGAAVEVVEEVELFRSLSPLSLPPSAFGFVHVVSLVFRL